MTQKERYQGVLTKFREIMPSPETELEYDTPFHLLLAVILSAQCTDKMVNKITPALFEAYPTPQSLADATFEQVLPYVKSINYNNTKARNIIAAAKVIVEKFGGEVPTDIDSMLEIPGVGRKTANVMLAVVWKHAAMPVDTHVFRVSNRLGLTNNSPNPLKTEKALVKYIPDADIPDAHHWLILHGRYCCKARNPECESCPVAEFCKSCKGFLRLKAQKEKERQKQLKAKKLAQKQAQKEARLAAKKGQ